MKICIVAEQLDRPETAVIRRLSAKVAMRVVCSPEEPRLDELEAAGIEVLRLPLRGRYDWRAIRTLRALARETDLFHCLRNNRPVANMVAALIGLKGPRLVAYRGTMGNLGRFDPGSRATYLNRRVDRLICVSEGVRQYLLGLGIPSERAVTIHKGHEPSWYQSESPFDREAELGIPPGAFVVGLVANMRELKGTDLLVEAMGRIANDEGAPPHHLVLVGEVRDKALRTLLDERAAAPQPSLHIHELGFRADATRISGTFDVAVMPSRRREGLPRSVIESMAQGVPAVVSNVGGLPELVRDGREGLVVPPNTIDPVANALRRFRDDSGFRDSAAQAARRRIETDFHVARTVEKTLTLYRDVLGP